MLMKWRSAIVFLRHVSVLSVVLLLIGQHQQNGSSVVDAFSSSNARLFRSSHHVSSSTSESLAPWCSTIKYDTIKSFQLTPYQRRSAPFLLQSNNNKRLDPTQGKYSSDAAILCFDWTTCIKSTSISATRSSRRRGISTRLFVKSETDIVTDDERSDPFFNGRTVVSLVLGQSVLIVAAALAAWILGTPNFGFGPGISFSFQSILAGIATTAPLGLLAFFLDKIESKYPALQDVSKATQRSILTLMGGTFKPVIAICIAIALGTAAGFGEEMLFRGIFQYEVVNRFGPAIGIGCSSIIFGLLHAVTPLYAVLATIASVYFGLLYSLTNNLAIPIACHTFYDIGALFYAHWTVSQLSLTEQEDSSTWEGPGNSSSSDIEKTTIL